jgi:hypothetical protein
MRPPSVWEMREKWRKVGHVVSRHTLMGSHCSLQVMIAAAAKREGTMRLVFQGAAETNLPPREEVGPPYRLPDCPD